MQIEIWTLGKPKTKYLEASIMEYEKRLKRYISVKWRYFPASKHKEKQKIVADESQRLLEAWNGRDRLLLLDERGALWNNAQWVDMLQDEMSHNPYKLIMLIGGAYGVSPELRDRSEYVLSLSPLVFPHELVRLVLIEQLYRNFSIIHGSGYHHS